MSSITVTVGGELFPVEIEAIDAETTARIAADLGLSVEVIVAKVLQGQADEIDRHEVVALQVASLIQSDEPADHRWLLRRMTVGTVCEVVASVELPDEVPA